MIERHNFHWQQGWLYNFPLKRKLFNMLTEETGSKQIISLTGLRRTGKTTILKQLIDHLITSEGIERERILFYSFDEEQPKIEDVIREYETKLGKNILQTKARVYIFLDEIQKLDNWQYQIKRFYDSYPNLKFFISGSSSLFIRKQAMESLAGRIYEFTLDPLSFEEFLMFKNKQELIKKRTLLSDELKKEFSAYQKRQFIELLNESEERAGQYVKTLVEKIVYQDVPKIFPIEQEELLLKILKIVSSNPGMLSDYDSLSRELGTNRITLSNYFYYLEESFLIRKLYNFSRNMLTSEKKLKKFYLSTTSFFPFLNNGIDETSLIENLIVGCTKARFFWRTPQKYEVDIILKGKEKIVPLEVKYKEDVTDKDMKNLLRFCEKFKISEALMVTKGKPREQKFTLKNNKRITIKIVPAWEFLLDIDTKNDIL